MAEEKKMDKVDDATDFLKEIFLDEDLTIEEQNFDRVAFDIKKKFSEKYRQGFQEKNPKPVVLILKDKKTRKAIFYLLIDNADNADNIVGMLTFGETINPVDMSTQIGRLKYLRLSNSYAQQILVQFYKYKYKNADSTGEEKIAKAIIEPLLGHEDETKKFEAIKLMERGNKFENQGDFSRAFTQYKKAFDLYQESQGLYDSDTLKALKYLGVVLAKQGNFSEAIKWFNLALAGYKITEGVDGRGTLDTIYNLSISLGQLGVEENNEDYLRKAADLLSDAIVGYKKTLGDDNIVTLDTIQTLADVNAEIEKLQPENTRRNKKFIIQNIKYIQMILLNFKRIQMKGGVQYYRFNNSDDLNL